MKLTEDKLIECGFKYLDYNTHDKKIFKPPLMKHVCNNLYHIRISDYSNHISREWYCHIDNEDFETIAGVSIDTIEQFNDLMKLMDIDYRI